MKGQFSRRRFLGTVGTAAVASQLAFSSSAGHDSGKHADSAVQADVPDTLDLAESARSAVNALTGIRNPKNNYMPYQYSYLYFNPPYLTNIDNSGEVVSSGTRMWGKLVEALLKMRLMSGSDQQAEHDQQSLDGMVSCIGPKDLYWTKPAMLQKDGTLVRAEDYSHLYAHARTMLGLLTQYQLDENPRWLELAHKGCQGIAKIAVSKQDYAYFPSVLLPASGFSTTAEPSLESMLTNPDESLSSDDAQITYGGMIRTLCLHYRLTGDEKSLEFAGKLARYLRQFRMWMPEAEPAAVVAADHGHFRGHLHSYCWGLWGMLDYADAANDRQFKAFVRDGYEYMRNFGVSRIGLFAEGCTVGDMVALAVRLSEVGVGDYWDDAERYTRNHLAELQYRQASVIQQISESSPQHQVRDWETGDNVAQRLTGGTAVDAGHVSIAMIGGALCCTYNGSLGRYYAWKGITSQQNGAAQVNLLLNRTSPWLDVDSYLPYEGKTVIRNKTARSVAVRMPAWVDLRAVSSTLNGKSVDPIGAGRYLVFDGLTKGEVIAIQFAVAESKEVYHNGYDCVPMPGHTEITMPGVWRNNKLVTFPTLPADQLIAHSAQLRGNTVVDMSPRQEGRGYPLYLRDDMKAARAPMKKRSNYVATKFA